MKSGLRGRGGAGFPTGVKWGFLPKDYQGPRYLCCNADESEPGTFKDRQLIERDPHQMLEGIVLACYAIGAETAYIYIQRRIRPGRPNPRARRSARPASAGYIGKNILGTGDRPSTSGCIAEPAPTFAGRKPHCWSRSKANAACLASSRPFPATHGLYNKPTVVNNVETLANLPHIINRGPEWFASIGSPPKSTGTRIFCVSGHVKRPGNYEVPMGITFRELIYEHAGGMRSDKPLKAFIPGGASAPFLTPGPP